MQYNPFKCIIIILYCLILFFGCATEKATTKKKPNSDVTPSAASTKEGGYTVTVTGYGNQEPEARRDAIKQAVEHVVGVYVVSEQITKNDKIIKDEILSQSNGFVSDFSVKNKGKDPSGLYFVTANVTVLSTTLTKRLGELNIGLKDLGTDKYKAVTESHFDAKSDFKTVVKEVVYTPLVSDQGVYQTDIVEIKRLNFSDLKVPISWKNQGDENRAKLGELTPHLIRFKHGLSPRYFDRLNTMLEKTSAQNTKNPDGLGNSLGNLAKGIALIPVNVGRDLIAPVVPKEKEQAYFKINFLEPDLKSQYNEYGKSWHHELQYRKLRTFYFLPDQGQIFEVLHQDFMRNYKPVTTITLVRANGSIISKNLFISGTSEVNSRFKNDTTTTVSTSENIQLEMEFRRLLSKETKGFPINFQNSFLLTALQYERPLFYYHNAVDQVVLFLDKDSSINLKDVKVETKWMRL